MWGATSGWPVAFACVFDKVLTFLRKEKNQWEGESEVRNFFAELLLLAIFGACQQQVVDRKGHWPPPGGANAAKRDSTREDHRHFDTLGLFRKGGTSWWSFPLLKNQAFSGKKEENSCIFIRNLFLKNQNQPNWWTQEDGT